MAITKSSSSASRKSFMVIDAAIGVKTRLIRPLASSLDDDVLDSFRGGRVLRVH